MTFSKTFKLHLYINIIVAKLNMQIKKTKKNCEGLSDEVSKIKTLKFVSHKIFIQKITQNKIRYLFEII